MIKVKLTYPIQETPLIRQTSGENGIWGNCKFYINQDIKECDFWVVYEGLQEREKTKCPLENTIFVCGEPPSKKTYSKYFLNQFKTIITTHDNLKHKNIIQSQLSIPWIIGRKYLEQSHSWEKSYTKNYDELINNSFNKKNKLISTISSNKNNTQGLIERLNFINYIKNEFEKVDIFGRGINTFPDKWDAISPYKYNIVIENSYQKNYWSEKLTDCFLSDTYPIYYGCPNIKNYFPDNSLTIIDIKKPKEALKIINETINLNKFEKSKLQRKIAKEKILNEYQLFPVISKMCNKDLNYKKTKKIIYPENRKRILYFPKKIIKKLCLTT